MSCRQVLDVYLHEGIGQILCETGLSVVSIGVA